MTKRKDENGRPAKENEPAAKPGSLPVDVGPETETATSEHKASDKPAAAAEPTPAEIEIAKLNDRLLRLQADFENFRKRVNREREELQKRGGEAVLRDLIPVLDHLEFGLQQALSKPGGDSFAEGLRLIQAQLSEAVRKHGLEEISALGLEFNPRLHESVASAPSTDLPEGKVITQTRMGYKLGDRLLRPAMVVVSAGPGPAGAARNDEPAAED